MFFDLLSNCLLLLLDTSHVAEEAVIDALLMRHRLVQGAAHAMRNDREPVHGIVAALLGDRWRLLLGGDRLDGLLTLGYKFRLEGHLGHLGLLFEFLGVLELPLLILVKDLLAVQELVQ